MNDENKLTPDDHPAYQATIRDMQNRCRRGRPCGRPGAPGAVARREDPMKPIPDGTGYALARVIRAAFKAKQSLTVIDAFKEPGAKGDMAVRPAGAITPEVGATATESMSFVLLEEQAAVRCAVADGDDDPTPVSMVAIAKEVRVACCAPAKAFCV